MVYPRALPSLYFLYMYVSEQGEALILAIDGTNKTIYSITRASLYLCRVEGYDAFKRALMVVDSKVSVIEGELKT